MPRRSSPESHRPRAAAAAVGRGAQPHRGSRQRAVARTLRSTRASSTACPVKSRNHSPRCSWWGGFWSRLQLCARREKRSTARKTSSTESSSADAARRIFPSFWMPRLWERRQLDSQPEMSTEVSSIVCPRTFQSQDCCQNWSKFHCGIAAILSTISDNVKLERLCTFFPSLSEVQRLCGLTT